MSALSVGLVTMLILSVDFKMHASKQEVSHHVQQQKLLFQTLPSSYEICYK